MNKTRYSLLFCLVVIGFGSFVHNEKQAVDFGTTDDKGLFLRENVKCKTKSNTSELWTPVSEIENGAIYMIRSVGMPNLYWDVRNGDFSTGTPIQLYDYNCTASQKFTFKRQFDLDGDVSYSLSPLYAFDNVLRFKADSTRSPLKISNLTFSDNDLFTDKISFVQVVLCPTHFYARVYDPAAKIYSYLTAPVLESGRTVESRVPNVYLREQLLWEIVKTDYLGLNVGNKVLINGTHSTRFVARVPYTGRYIIETRSFDGSVVDTTLELLDDFSGKRLAYNDDGDGRFSKITYDFSTTNEHSVLVRGYQQNVSGSCYLILRPAKTIYMSGTYDIDNQHCDRITSLLNAKQYCRDLGYFPEVSANLSHRVAFEETDWEDKCQMDRDYYVFYGHGGNDGRGAVYFDGPSPDWAFNVDLPLLKNAGLMLWMSCTCGRQYSSDQDGECIAAQCVKNGAKQSVGFAGDIYNITADAFIPAFFKALKNSSIEKALRIASDTAIRENRTWWNHEGYKLCDIANPFLFDRNGAHKISQKADVSSSLKGSCFEETLNSECSFVFKKDSNYIDVSKIASDVNQKVAGLKKEFEYVDLYLCGDDNEPLPIAMCTDTVGCVVKYIDLYTDEIVSPRSFEEMMRS